MIITRLQVGHFSESVERHLYVLPLLACKTSPMDCATSIACELCATASPRISDTTSGSRG